MRLRFGVMVALFVCMFTLFFSAFAAESSGLIGNLFIDFLVSISRGLLDAPAATAIYGVLALVVVRLIQFALARLPTRRRTIIGKLVWRLAEMLFGKEVSMENDVYATEDAGERADLKAQLKKRFPILDLTLKGE